MASGAGAGAAMREAAKEGNLEEVTKQLEAGAPINYRDRQGNTALHISALFGHREIAHLLLQRGADKTIKNNYGETPDEAANGVVLGDEIKNWSN